MKHLKTNFRAFVNEAITINVDELLGSINAKKVDFYDLKLPRDKYAGKSIEFLYDDDEFNRQLYKDKLKKSELQSSEETENFQIGRAHV